MGELGYAIILEVGYHLYCEICMYSMEKALTRGKWVNFAGGILRSRLLQLLGFEAIPIP